MRAAKELRANGRAEAKKRKADEMDVDDVGQNGVVEIAEKQSAKKVKLSKEEKKAKKKAEKALRKAQKGKVSLQGFV